MTFDILHLKKIKFMNSRKVVDNGFTKIFGIGCNRRRNRCRTKNIKIEGTCCWEISNRHGETEEFKLGHDKTPRIAYISRLKTKKCKN